MSSMRLPGIRTARQVLLAVGAVILLVTGCSTSGTKTLTSTDLSKTMPTAQNIGTDFHRDKAGETDTNNDTKLQVPKSCRALLNNDDDKDKVKAKRNFKDSKEREIDVAATVTKVTLESLEKAAKACKQVPFTSGSTKGTIAFTLEPSTGVGDKADALELVLKVTEPISLTVKGHGIFAKRGDVGISVVGLDGIDSQANIAPIDNATVDKVARALDRKIKDAQG